MSTLRNLYNYSFEGFFDGWEKLLSKEQLITLIKNSTYKIIAVDSDKHHSVGIITALSDKVNWAFIPYLEVIPEYQKQGIGKELIKRMLDRLDYISCIDLMCDREVQPFYEKFGMSKSNGMVIRRYLDKEK